MAKKATTPATPKVTSRRTTYIVGNATQAAIVIPRKSGLVAARVAPLIIPKGHSVEVDSAEWNELKKTSGVRNYMEAGLIIEVKKVGEIHNVTDRTSRPIIPEHLTRDEEKGNQTEVTASVRRKNRQTIAVD